MTHHLRALLAAALLPAFAFAFAFAACGEDSDDDGGPDSAGTGSDEDYVSGICDAVDKFQEDFSDAFANADEVPNPDDFAEPFENFVKDLKKLKPPSDLQQWHSQTVDAFEDTVDQLKNADSLDDLDDTGTAEFPELPAAAKDRLTAVADRDEDCQQLEEDFGPIFE